MFVSLLLEVADGRKRSDGDEGSGTAARRERREEEEEGEEEGTKTRGLRLVGTTKEEEEGGESRPVESEFVSAGNLHTNIDTHTHTHTHTQHKEEAPVSPGRQQTDG